jgi:hypothetical protein
MVSKKDVKKQLKRIKADFRFWGSSEIAELPRVLFEDEIIKHAVNGRYENGFALLVATNHRLLLIDKKPFFLTLEDLRYEMIAEVDFTQQLLSSKVLLRTSGKTLKFISFNADRLRNLTGFVQEQVMHMRQGFAYRTNDAQQQSKIAGLPSMLVDAPRRHGEAAAVNPVDALQRVVQRPSQLLFRKRVPKFYRTSQETTGI